MTYIHRLKHDLEHIRKDKLINTALLASACTVFIHAGILIAFFFRLPPYLPLYAKLPWGYARLGTQWEILIPLGITVLIFLTNTFISMKLYAHNPLLSRLLCVTSLIISVLFFLFVIQLLWFIL